jgi:Tfp pilus assembly protein PilF
MGVAPAFNPAHVSSVGLGVATVTPGQYLCSQPGVILHYLWLSVWPEHLCLDYRWPVARTVEEILVPGSIVLGLMLASVVALRYWPRIGFLGAAFFLILAPTSSLIPIADLAFEHRMYLPLAAVVTLGVLSVFALVQQILKTPEAKRVLMVTGLGFLSVGLILRTIQRNGDYLEPERIWRGALAINPNNDRAHYNLAVELEHNGNMEGAAHELARTVHLNPWHKKAHNNLAIRLAARGDFTRAIEHYEHAIRIDPQYTLAHDNLGNLYVRRGEYDAAVAQYRKAVEIDPSYPAAHMHLGGVYYRQGNRKAAAQSLRVALQLDPNLTAAVKLLDGIETSPEAPSQIGSPFSIPVGE